LRPLPKKKLGGGRSTQDGPSDSLRQKRYGTSRRTRPPPGNVTGRCDGPVFEHLKQGSDCVLVLETSKQNTRDKQQESHEHGRKGVPSHDRNGRMSISCEETKDREQYGEEEGHLGRC